MKKIITVTGLFCAVSLFAQSFNTTYYAPNGGYVGSSTQYNNTFSQPSRARGF